MFTVKLLFLRTILLLELSEQVSNTISWINSKSDTLLLHRRQMRRINVKGKINYHVKLGFDMKKNLAFKM